MPVATISYVAVILGAVSNMVLGFLWYGPLFGKPWMKLMNMTKDQMKGTDMGKAYGLTAVAALVMSYVLAHFVDYVGATTLMDGAVLGFWLWLGFVATVAINNVLWGGKSWNLYAIDVSYFLVALMVMGAINGTL